MHKKDETMDEFNGQTLPGTGGDFVDTQDVEGHRAPTQKAVDDEAGPDGQKRMVNFSGDESDVEGHRAPTQKAVDDEAGPDGQKRMVNFSGDESDVEGHGLRRDAEPDGLYRGGPTTQGEVIRRGPGDNPNGDR
jgi:hypothetical protein